MCYQIEKLIKDNADKLDEADKNELNAKVAALKDAMNANDVERMKAGMDDLQKATYTVSEKLYKNAAPQQPADGAAQSSNPGSDNVYNAEYKDVDDNNNP